MSDLKVELSAALATIRLAGAEVMRLYASFEKIADAPANISTEADRNSQDIIVRQLSEAFPEDGFCGEESTATLKAAKSDGVRLWVIDPIDGTRGFAKKTGEFSIMIGLVQWGVVVLGVVYEPGIDRVTYAVRGQGCHWAQPFDSKPIACQVTDTSDLSNAVFSMSRSQGTEGEKQMLGVFGAKGAVQTYSAGIKLAQVARGETDVYVGDYLTMKDWDICAGHILVEEAGGRMTRNDGEPLVYGIGDAVQGKGFIATNGKLHLPVLEVLATGAVKF